jgi:ketosteroid isomerase-like protein
MIPDPVDKPAPLHREESTTRSLVELVRDGFEALNRRDVDGLVAFYAPDALMDGTRTILDLRRGRAAIRGVAADWMGAYEELEYVAEEPVELGNGVVFTVVSQKGRLVGAAGYLHQREGWIFVFVDDLAASVIFYPEAQIDAARGAAERLAKERADG